MALEAVATLTTGSSVCAVVVTFHPDAATVRATVDAVTEQVSHVVVVDNASVELPDLAPAEVIALERNVGLAAAQNRGIARARELGASHVLILDQDSIAGPGMVVALLDAAARLHADGQRVAAVGPTFCDPREQRPAPFVRVAFPMSHKLWCRPGQLALGCDFLISSGALIGIDALDELGEMDEGLFIDNVDMEWSFRARSRGWSLFGVCAATMTHHLGDARQPVLAGRVQVVRHAPVRLYYIMRNRLLLYRMPHTPRVWIAQDLPRVLAKFLIGALLVAPRGRNVRCMVRGLLDGVRGRRGPAPAGLAGP
jgi:rhamnosyltransferase